MFTQVTHYVIFNPIQHFRLSASHYDKWNVSFSKQISFFMIILIPSQNQWIKESITVSQHYASITILVRIKLQNVQEDQQKLKDRQILYCLSRLIIKLSDSIDMTFGIMTLVPSAQMWKLSTSQPYLSDNRAMILRERNHTI